MPFVGTVPAIKPAAERYTVTDDIGARRRQGTVARDYTQNLIAQFRRALPVTLVGSKHLARSR